MSAPAYPLARRTAPPRPEPRFSLRDLAPREGWIAFLLVAFLLVLLAWSLDAADYRGGDLYWLTWVVLLGVTWGLLAARLRLARWEAHGLGALIGAGVVLVLAAGQISSAPDLGARLSALGQAAVRWYIDVTGPTHLSQENVAWQLIIGIVAWTTAQFSSYALFGHRRPLVAIVVPGVFLLVNMIIAANVDLTFLVLYTAAALLLLVRVNLVEQRDAWARRRIGEAESVGGVAARSGLVIVGSAVVLAVFLSTVGSSAPLAGLWTTFQGRATDVVLRVNDWFNLSPAVRFHGDPFESSQIITGKWDASGLDTLRVTMSDGGRHYLRGTVYDRFLDGNRWIQSGVTSTQLQAGAPLADELAGDGDVDEAALTAITVNVNALRDLRVIITPGLPLSLSIPVRLERLGEDGPFAALRPAGDGLTAGTSYDVSVLVPKVGSAGLTKNQLRNAGTDYPPGIIARYATLSADSGAFNPAPVGHPSVAELAATLVQQDGLTNPFDIADAYQYYLSDPSNFTYASDVRGKCGAGEAVADCFLRIREGYCEYYATTKILMLRSQGIPARLVVGYLPPGSDGIVISSSAHAWVEVYFPGHGWTAFDPTGGNGAAPVQYPEGPAVSGQTPPPSDITGNDALKQRLQRERDAQAAGGGTRTIGTSLLPLIVGGIAAVGLAFLWLWRRRTRRQPDVVAVYTRMTRLAGWFGFPPRASQTVFEYTGSLADIVPEARPELESVARAKVEATYRPVPLDRERLRAVAEAYRKLRLELTRLLFRRGRRPPSPDRGTIRRR
jgi:transglutaminase-like putative cysteine protease